MAEYLGRMGSMIVILTLLFVAVILATQFSFGRLFSMIFAAMGSGLSRSWHSFRSWIEERRKARQRRDVIAKHVKKGTASPEVLKTAAERAARPEPVAPKAKIARQESEEEDEDEVRTRVEASASRPTPPVVQTRPGKPVAAPLPLSDAEPVGRGPAGRRMSGYAATSFAPRSSKA